MNYVDDMNFYIVPGWVVTRLHLTKLDKELFCIIYGFSQDGQSKYTGSLTYFTNWTGYSKPAVIESLKRLVDRNLIIKHEKYISNIKFCSYSVNLDLVRTLIPEII